MARRNRMPRRGAILIANGKARTRKTVDFSKVLARLKKNPLAIRENGKRRHNRRRRNPLAIRTNGLALRMNGLAIRSNGKRRHNRRRKNAVALRMNRKYRFNKRHARRNPSLAGVEAMVAKVPVVGKFAAPIVVPAAAAAVIVGGVHYGIKYAMPMIPARVSSMLAPVAYTAGAAAMSLILAFVPSSILSTSTKKMVAGLAVAGGGAVDGIRYLTAREDASIVPDTTSGLGEGGYWQLAGDPDSAAVAGMYRDCSYADAAACGPDLDPTEGEACIAGARAWCATFPATIQVTRTADGGASRHAGKHGHRWGWAIASLGFPTFRKIAALPAAKRVETLGKLRHAAMSAHHGASHGGGYGALVMAQ